MRADDARIYIRRSAVARVVVMRVVVLLFIMPLMRGALLCAI